NIMHPHTQVPPLKFQHKLPSQFSTFHSLSHLHTLIHTKHYPHLHQSINPIQPIQQLQLQSAEDNQ
ncbi:hypothetical protein, partial [Staphylococcus hominis]|uniref:hypothetical protein n=1 Tax=Staphylococcus hominis TaxID=1290 RepID=UPI001C930AE6